MMNPRIHYKSEVPKETYETALQIEQTRQALLREEATEETLVYARYLLKAQNDATLSHGRFKTFSCEDEEVIREYPFLQELVYENNEQ